MARFWKLLSVLIFIGIFIFICLYHSISNTYFTLPKEENIQVKERNHGLFDTNTKVYAVNPKDEISKELNLLPYFKQRHSMMAFNITNLPDQTVIRNKTGKKKQSQTNVKSETPYILKLKKNNKAIRMNSDSSSNVHTETERACRMSFDRETLYKARKKLLESKSYYLFHVHLKIDWLENDSSEHKDELMHWQYIVKDEQFLIQFPVDFDLLTYNMLVYDHEEKILEVKLLYNNSNCIEEDFEAKLQSARRLLWENLLHNDTDHYLCNRNFQKETGRKWLYYLTTIWIGYDLNCSDISYKNYLDIITIEKDHLPLVAPMFCYLLSLQFVWIFVLLDIKKKSKAPKTDNESRTVTVKETIEADPLPTDKSLRGSTFKCIYDTEHETENVIFDHTDTCVITIADNTKMRVKYHMMTTIEMTPVHTENTYTTPMTNDDQMYTNNKSMSQNDKAHDSEVDKLVTVEIHGSSEKGKETSNNKNTGSSKKKFAGKLKMSEEEDFKPVAKKEEKKIETFQTDIADKDKANMSGEQNASEDDENTCKIDENDVETESVAKKGEKKIETFQTDKADKDKANMSGEQNASEDDENTRKIDEYDAETESVAKKEEKKIETFQTDKADKDKANMSGEQNASEDDENTHKINEYDDKTESVAKKEEKQIETFQTDKADKDIANMSGEQNASEDDENTRKIDEYDAETESVAKKEEKKIETFQTDKADKDKAIMSGEQNASEDDENTCKIDENDVETESVAKKGEKKIETFQTDKADKDKANMSGEQNASEDDENTRKIDEYDAKTESVAKKEEKKIETFQTDKADKDKANMSGEQNASEDDENTRKIDEYDDETESVAKKEEKKIGKNTRNIDIYDDDIYCYAKNERPYGIKRFFIKLLFDKCCCRNDCCCNNATVRLLFLLWLIILLFFGFYRTVGRFLLLKETYDDYLTVVLPSEPFFLILRNLEVKDKNLYIVILDAIYAIGFPLIYIYFGCMSYQSFFKSEQRIYSCISEDNDWKIITKDEVSYKFTIPFYEFCRTTKKLCFFKGCCSCDNCEDCMKISCECICNWLKYFVSLWIFLLFILCVFPIIPFSCNARICSCCDAKEEDSKMRKRSYGFCVHIGNFISFSIFYFLCLRPIISTFTFLFRSFTYFVFVALPIRIHILRYTLIVVTTVTYLAKYFHEIVNMNAEILDFIFICEKKRKHKNVKHVSENLYDYIYGRALFVQRKFFVLFLKIIVVFMYLFITIETFITNQNSLTGTSFDKLLEFLFIIIGPYAISFFLKGDKNDFLTDENKQDLEELYERFCKKANDKVPSLHESSSVI